MDAGSRSDHDPGAMGPAGDRLIGVVRPDAHVERDQPHHSHSSSDHIHPHMDPTILGDLQGDGGIEERAGHGLLLLGTELLESRDLEGLSSRTVHLQIKGIQSRKTSSP